MSSVHNASESNVARYIGIRDYSSRLTFVMQLHIERYEGEKKEEAMSNNRDRGVSQHGYYLERPVDRLYATESKFCAMLTFNFKIFFNVLN